MHLNEDYGWAMFFDNHAKDLHTTFKSELSKQLFEKGEQTGIKQFHKYNFQMIIGMQPLNLEVSTDKVIATIEFITPTSFSIPVKISWQTKVKNIKLIKLHLEDIGDAIIEFNWEAGFPTEEVKHHIRPYKKSKAVKNGFDFDVEYFYLQIPDVELELYFKNELNTKTITEINKFLKEFRQLWDGINKGKEIQYISELTNKEDNYSIILDVGLKNDIKLIHQLIEGLNKQFGKILTKVQLK